LIIRSCEKNIPVRNIFEVKELIIEAVVWRFLGAVVIAK
jgi:hypothetical protein